MNKINNALGIITSIFCVVNVFIGITTDDPHQEIMCWIKYFGWFFTTAYFFKEAKNA